MPWYRSKVEVAIDHRTSLKSALQLVYIEVEAGNIKAAKEQTGDLVCSKAFNIVETIQLEGKYEPNSD